jgi:conjugative transfer region lipoprotein (TIGR03751 family)
MCSRPSTHTAARASISAVWLLALAGCAGTKESLLPQGGPTMLEIYQQHFERMETESAQGGARERLRLRPLASEESDLAGYTRAADTEGQSLFRHLPNPTLVMYVFPHLSTEEGHPVPGYATSFPMYEHPPYALPGEVP